MKPRTQRDLFIAGLSVLATLIFSLSRTPSSVTILPKLQEVVQREPHFMPNATLLQVARAHLDAHSAVVLTVSNYAYRSMLMNQICSLRAAGVRNYIIGAKDRDMLEYCQRMNLPCYKSYDSDDVAYVDADKVGTDSYKAIVSAKPKAVSQLLPEGINVLFLDSDVFMVRNPLPALQSRAYESYHILASPETGDRGPFNSGVYYAKASPHSVQAFDQILEYIRENQDTVTGDQDTFNRILAAEFDHTYERKWHTRYWQTKDNVRTRLLSMSEFGSACKLSKDPTHWHWPENFSSALYTIHANCMTGMAEKMAWLTASGLIAYDASDPDFRCLPM